MHRAPTVDELIAALAEPGPLIEKPAVQSLLPELRAHLDALEVELDELEGLPARRPALTLIRGGRDAC